MLNIPADCGKSICELGWNYVRYKVLIHGSKETLNTDLHCTEYPFVIVEEDKGAIGSISKSNLDSISTDENSCAADETHIRAGCQVTKVIKRGDQYSIYLTCLSNCISLGWWSNS